MAEPPESILSHGEQDVAGYLREHPDATPAEIADARGTDEEAVEKAIDRIREKTRRAAATLEGSPFAAEVLEDLDAETREALLEALQD